jgi:hypothetical protein
MFLRKHCRSLRLVWTFPFHCSTAPDSYFAGTWPIALQMLYSYIVAVEFLFLGFLKTSLYYNNDSLLYSRLQHGDDHRMSLRSLRCGW